LSGKLNLRLFKIKNFIMAKFITSIQLHDADESDYNKLEHELEKELFRKEKPATKNKSSDTSKGEFRREGKVTIQDVTKAVFNAVTKTGKNYSFTIIRHKPLTS
jgi:hypothetical protein